MSIRAAVFDFGNVLGFFSHRRAAEQLAAFAAGVTPDAIQAVLFSGVLENDFERGAMKSADFRAMVRERFRLSCTDAQFDQAYADMFWPNPEICGLVPRLKGRYRLLLLSNTTDIHASWFCRQFAEVLGHFDHLVLSHEVGCRKPDCRIYQHAIALAGCAPGECLFVDDLPTNVAGAVACGMQGLVYRPNDDLIRRLQELGISGEES